MRVAVSLLAAVLAAAASAQDAPLRAASEPSPKEPLELGQAPPFTLPSLRELRLVTSGDFAGKVALIVIFRTDCPKTERSADAIEALRAKFAARGFEVLGVADDSFDAVADPIEKALNFAREHHWGGPLALNDGGEFQSGYYHRIRGTPSAYLLHRDGNLDFLGQDPAREEMLPDLEKRIDRALEEPAPKGAATAVPASVSVRGLPDFTLVSWRGGAIRTKDLRGKPALLALLSPALAARHGAMLSALASKYGPSGLRVIGVVFGSHKEIQAEVEARSPGYELAIPDAEAQQSLAGEDPIPKFIFVTADGKILKEIKTIYQRGTEAAVLDRYAAVLLGKDVRLPELVEAKANLQKLEYRSSELGFGLDPPRGYRQAEALSGERARFVGARSQEVTVRYDSRLGASEEAVNKLADATGNDLAGREVESREWKEVNGTKGLLLKERWSSPLGGVKAMRLFLPASGGIYIVTGSARDSDFTKDAESIERSLLSFERGLQGRG